MVAVIVFESLLGTSAGMPRPSPTGSAARISPGCRAADASGPPLEPGARSPGYAFRPPERLSRAASSRAVR
jgi:hypothetical protein